MRGDPKDHSSCLASRVFILSKMAATVELLFISSMTSTKVGFMMIIFMMVTLMILLHILD